MSTNSMQTDHAACGCPEYQRLSRRGFLAATGLTALAASAPAWLPRVAVAKSHRGTMRDVVISVYLRGASDGLSMCVPYADPNYYSARPTIAVPQPGSGLPGEATNLDGFFGLPPAMLPLIPAYQAGHLLFVQAAGSTDPSRSHFDAQRFMEVGKAQDPTISSGWLGRHLASVAPMDPSALLRAVGISTGLARTLVGGPLTLPIPNLASFNITGSSTTRAARRDALEDMYLTTQDPLHAAAFTTFQTIDLLQAINFAAYAPSGGAVYPTNSFGNAMKSVAALLKAQVGVEAVAVDVNGWDTHSNQGVITGTMANLMNNVALTLAAFHADLTSGAVQPGFVVAAMSEFGRRVAENGSFGTDHGHGNCMMLLGQAVQGGRVYRTSWPGLAPANLYQGLDLQVTTDYRDVLAEMLADRAGATDLAGIFPGYTPTFRGLTAS